MSEQEYLSKLYFELCQALKLENFKYKLQQLSKEYGSQNVLWMLKIIREDYEIGTEF